MRGGVAAIRLVLKLGNVISTLFTANAARAAVAGASHAVGTSLGAQGGASVMASATAGPEILETGALARIAAGTGAAAVGGAYSTYRSEQRVRELRAENAELGEEVQGLRAENTELREEVHGLAADNTNLRTELEEANDTNQRLGIEVRARDVQLLGANAMLQARNAELQEANETNQRLGIQVRARDVQLLGANAMLQARDAELREANATHEMLEVRFQRNEQQQQAIQYQADEILRRVEAQAQWQRRLEAEASRPARLFRE